MKHILSVQDLSCVGRCSLTIALPVLSAMGIRCSVLPTAVFSTHTAFPDPVQVDLTDSLSRFISHWQENGITFDAIYVGYLSDPRQADIIRNMTGQFHCPVVLDPVMGDSGRLYSRVTPEHIDAMRSLCGIADVVIPNITEACALTENVYDPFPDGEKLNRMVDGLKYLGAKNAVITGVQETKDTLGFYGANDQGYAVYYQAPLIRRSFHGAGDLFASVLAGSYVSGMDLQSAARKAAEFVRLCVEHTPESTPHGIEFEPFLHRLGEDFCRP